MMVYVPLSSLAVRLLLHFVHLNALSPVWVPSCAFKFYGSEKLRSHFVQLNALRISRAAKKLLAEVAR